MNRLLALTANSALPEAAPRPPSAPIDPASAAAIDRFIEALWIEDGLSANTLAAYRADLELYARWLAGTGEDQASSQIDRVLMDAPSKPREKPICWPMALRATRRARPAAATVA